ncbi:glycosyltransferase family 2 protein [Candidatus Merdisoma sp. JLR.KK011]|uniref:glycosyltransferase family 2 protein n=1 Tax=Candidatus Merdisoma sp. JLR.KK011 TaxID=3114299 RepID=UPI002FEE8A07
MLSVIVPIYNAEKYLSRCIESIINQTYRLFELLLVDDGSTDRSSQICDEYAQLDSRIKVIHKKNEGLVKARKEGLQEARGEYIAFVDNDDWIELDMYENMIDSLESSGADFVDTGYFCEKDNSSYIERKLERGVYELDKYMRHKVFLALLELDDFMNIRQSIWSKVFKASLIKNSYANVPDRMQSGEDLINIVHCILQSGRIIQTEGVFYHYNYREESLSHLRSISYIRQQFEIWNYSGKLILANDEFMRQEDLDRCLFYKWYSAFQYQLFNEFDSIQNYSFPCIEKLFGKRVAIYGAGNVGKDYITQISKYEKCHIVCWVDKCFKKMQFPYRKVIGIEDFLKKQYDMVLIAVEKKEIAEEMKQFLMDKGIKENKIIWCKPNAII